MKNIIYRLLLITVGCYGMNVQAQSIGPSTLNASGASKTINGNTYEYSIGEMVLVHTSIHPNLVVTQGVLQPTKASTGIGDVSILTEDLNVFPNPFYDVIHLRPNWKLGGRLSISLLDITGRELLHWYWDLQKGNEQQSIQLGNLAAGAYMLQVQYKQVTKNHIGTFKIQKIQ